MGTSSTTDPPDLRALRTLVGERIRQLRIERGFSQQELADLVRVSVQAVSQWENGKSQPDVWNALALTGILSVSIDYLFNRSDNRHEGGVTSYDVDKLYNAIDLDVAYDFIYNNYPNSSSRFPVNIKPTYSGSRKISVFRVTDQSMLPNYSPSDIVLIDADRPIEPGQDVIAIVYSSKNVILRKYAQRYDNELRRVVIDLKPYNADYPIQSLVDQDAGLIVGAVIEHRRFPT